MDIWYENLPLLFGSWVMVFMNFIPISLMLTLDVVRVLQSFIIQADKKMVYKPKLYEQDSKESGKQAQTAMH